MERILFNLLSNAFKFTLEGGSIRVEIDKLSNKAVENKTWLSIRVCDTGVGIAADKHEKIFETFFQDSSEPGILNQGTGIGLSITKEFIRMQGGNIRVESEPGKGTCFIMEMPFEQSGTQVMEANANGKKVNNGTLVRELAGTSSIPAPGPLSEKASILLVEDNDDFRYYLKEELEKNYRLFEAANGKEGWQKALAEHPQLIVSDISMPYMDGIELCKKIKADKRTNHIPVILLTALTSEQDQLKGLEIGANDYITKPFNIDMLNAKVKNLLTLNYSFKNTYSKQIKILSPELTIESEDEKLLSSIMENHE
jgi:CheY-like chemotaxis protein